MYGLVYSHNMAISEIRKAFRQLNGDLMLIQTLREHGSNKGDSRL